jgi:hypothetical protein
MLEAVAAFFAWYWSSKTWVWVTAIGVIPWIGAIAINKFYLEKQPRKVRKTTKKTNRRVTSK